MHYERLDEPVEMIVHFATDGARPLRFLWHGRAHRVEAVRGRWITLEGARRTYHYAVEAGGIGNCELTFDLPTMSWRIHSVAIEN